eukprot:TRINITY_DN5817_c0_g1_i5.p1 TRINITY_DN5817_c0_g1~~TRINITY_DN5817_c0_g1_i5.p1  ORF type:complete len:638 (+),score=140.92 TRINITY_DN5817_c0_g1_i5:52-1914(+)
MGFADVIRAVSRPTFRRSDSVAVREAKMRTVGCLVLFGLVVVPTMASKVGEFHFFLIGSSFGCVIIFGAYIALCLGVDITAVHYSAMIGGTLAILVVDYSGVMETGRTWSLMIVFVDVALVFKLRNEFTSGLVAVTVLWLMYVVVDQSILGFFREVRKFDGFDEPATFQPCDCAEPPCKLEFSEAVPDMLAAALVFLTDFYLTRGFAIRMRNQVSQMEVTVEMSQTIARHLSRYEVTEADQAIRDCSSALPLELQAIFTLLVRNLTQYKAFLPMSCLPMAGARDSTTSSGGVDAETKHTSEPPSPVASAGFSILGSDDASLSSRSLQRMASIEGITIRHEPRRKPVTLLCLNHRGFLHSIERMSPLEVAEVIGNNTHEFAQAVVATKGVVDLVSADHFFASFNTSRHYAMHRAAAVRCGIEVTRMEQDGLHGSRSAAVVSGVGCCGDFGSAQSNVIRYMVVAPVCSALLLLERLVSSVGAPLLIDSKARSDAGAGVDCLFWMVVEFAAKVWSERLSLWLVTGERVVAPEMTEWMYQVGAYGVNPWEQYNVAMRKVHLGKYSEAEDVVREIVPTDTCEETALRYVRECIRTEASLLARLQGVTATVAGSPVTIPWAVQPSS